MWWLEKGLFLAHDFGCVVKVFFKLEAWTGMSHIRASGLWVPRVVPCFYLDIGP